MLPALRKRSDGQYQPDAFDLPPLRARREDIGDLLRHYLGLSVADVEAIFGVAAIARYREFGGSWLYPMGYELVDWEQSPKGRYVRVFIDKPKGVSVEDCARVSRQLTRLFAVENVDFDRLEVSSPGLDRPLKTAADYARFAGQPVSRFSQVGRMTDVGRQITQGAGQRRAFGLLGQRQLGAGKEQPGEHHRLEQALLALGAQAGQQRSQTIAPPGIAQDGQTTIVQGAVELQVVGGQEGLAPQTAGDDFAHWGRQSGDVADGTGPGSLGGAKGLPHQIGEVSLVGTR